MKSNLLLVFCVASFAVSPFAQATSLAEIKQQLQSSPYETRVENNDVLFAKYCKGEVSAATIPQPNYNDALVKKAAGILTNTKVQADTRLNEKSKDAFVSQLSFIQETLTGLISSTKDEQVKMFAQTILDEVSAPNIVSITPAAKEAFEQFGSLVITKANQLAPQLLAGYKADLVGLDAKAIEALGIQLQKSLDAEVKPIDYASLNKSLQALSEAMQANKMSFDIKALQKAVAEYTAYYKANKPDDEYALSVAEELSEALKTGDQEQIQNISHTISSLQYFSTAEYLGADVPALKAAEAVFTKEYAKTSNGYFVNEVVNTYNSAINDDVDSLRYQLPQLIASIQSNAAENALWFGKTPADQQKTLSLVTPIKAEANKFALNALLEQVENMNFGFSETGGGQGGIDIATGELQYMLSPAPEGLTKNSMALIEKLRAEISKNSSQAFISNAQNLVDQLSKSNGKMSDDLVYAIQSVGYDLENVVAVSEATKKVQDAFKAMIADTDAYSSLFSYVDPLLTMAESGHFYFYGGVRRMYGLSDKLPEAAKKAGANKEAHWFLTQLCGEFRDRATMIEAKLKWIENLYILEQSETMVKDPATLAQAPNVWARITAAAYYPYIGFTSMLWEARRESQERYIKVGNYESIDNPVRGATVCETKYIFAKYIAEGREFDSIEEFDGGYESFKAGCPAADVSDYYDFRGDSNFKHYSPESNGMIWYATSMASACKSMTETKGKGFTSQDCENYFKRPYYYRYNAARAGLAAWLFRSEAYAEKFSQQGSMVAIYPHAQPDLAPYSYGFNQETTEGQLFEYDSNWLSIPGVWNMPDIGFNQLTGLGTGNVNADVAYERLRDAVDRHTDWYNSGYNDSVSTPKNQAYSPFVASSYEMSASNGFTSCGVTVQCPPDGLKRWMFIFRVKADNWYTPARIANNEPVDFDRMWIDETSFGVSGLADSEKAWDRLGTAMEAELDSILYLINVDDDGGGEFHGE